MSRKTCEYDMDGVVRVPHVFSPEEAGAIRHQIDAYVRDVVPTLPETDVVFEADGHSVRNLWRMEQHSAYFANLAKDQRILQCISPILGSDPVLLAVETFNKRARTGSAVPPHQDNAYFCLTPPDALTAWVAIDAVTEANGPVSYIRGSHTQGMRRHGKSGVAGNSMGIIEPLEEHDPYVGLLAPGDLLMHHCEVVHYSEANRSDFDRCGLLMVFRAAHCVVDPGLKKAYTGQESA